jgi:site-specific DNA-methyltransferase (cytosine-N4-specific)
MSQLLLDIPELKLTTNSKKIPELDVMDYSKELFSNYQPLIKLSGIDLLNVPVEFWSSDASNQSLGYITHNIFRYFGKFPPPVARHLIKEYTNEKEFVLDPMCGSGTTALEAFLLKRNFICYDINPLSVLISKVKVKKLDAILLHRKFDEILKSAKSMQNCSLKPNDPKIAENWFYPETIESIAKLKYSISKNTKEEIKDFFDVALLSCVRKASKATTQQGRLFKDIETALKDIIPLFQKKVKEMIKSLLELPESEITKSIIENKSINDPINKELKKKLKLIICHPPYFNLYKYSSINTLELNWMDNINPADIRKLEVREFFKIGKPENVTKYVEDMSKALINIHGYLSKNGVLAFMNGDTKIHGNYIPVNKMLLETLTDYYKVEKVALRIPKFTEASWAASQRRNGEEVGISLCDFVYILRPV